MQECIGVLFSSPKCYILYIITILMDNRWIKRKAPTMSSLFDSSRRQKKRGFLHSTFHHEDFPSAYGNARARSGLHATLDTLRTPVRCRTFNPVGTALRGHASILSDQCGHTPFAGTATQSLRQDENGTGSPCVGWFDHRCCHR